MTILRRVIGLIIRGLKVIIRGFNGFTFVATAFGFLGMSVGTGLSLLAAAGVMIYLGVRFFRKAQQKNAGDRCPSCRSALRAGAVACHKCGRLASDFPTPLAT